MPLGSLGTWVRSNQLARGTLGLAAIVAVTLCGPSTARAQITPYDDFNAPQIDPSKWLGQELHLVGFGGLELIRDIDFNMSSLQGRLQLSHRVAGGTFSSTGFTDNRNRLRFINPATITAVKFDVVITQISVPGCPAEGSTPSMAGAIFTGVLFHDPTVPADVNDLTGNVFVNVGVFRRSDSPDPPGVLRVFGALHRCPDPTCVRGTDLAGANLGTVATGDMVTLRMRWDQARKQVDFQKNADAVQSVTYTLDDSRPPSILFKTLDTFGAPANCAPPLARVVNEVTAFFDNVFVNP